MEKSRGPKPMEIVLGDAEREQLESWARRRTSSQALAARARIVLGAAQGKNNTQIAGELGLTRGDVRDAVSEPVWRDPTAILVSRAQERRVNRRRTVLDAPSIVPSQQARTFWAVNVRYY